MQKDKDMLKIVGGISFNGSIINALSTLFKTIYSIGQDLGGALRRISTNRVCKF